MRPVTRVTYYKHEGRWAYAAWTAEGFDHSDTLDADNPREAVEVARLMFPVAILERAEDC